MKKHSLPRLPNHSFVVMTNSSSMIKFNPLYRKAPEKVIRSAALRSKFEAFDKKHQQNILDKKQLQKFSRLLLNLHTPADPDIVKQFQIREEDILPGVYCTRCMRLTLVRIRGGWWCPHCGCKCKKAHVQALLDYCLLVSNSITVGQFKQFLMLDSRSVASKLLRTLNLPSAGNNRDRTYELSVIDLQQRMEEY